MARKGENIFHRKDGRWEARYISGYHLDGSSKYSYVYGKTYQEVKGKRVAMLMRLGESQKNGICDVRAEFSQKLDEWLEFEKTAIKLSTYSYYLSIINKHIRPLLGGLCLNDIDDMIISNFISIKMEEGLKISTVREIAVILKQILNFCNLNIKVKMPKAQKNKIDTLSRIDKERLETYINNNINEFTIGILFSLYCGLRIGEVCALRWTDIDFDTNTLYIQRTVTRVCNVDNERDRTKLIINDAKTINSIREIPLNRSFVKLLKVFKKGKNMEHFILSSSNKYIDPRNYYNQYKKILKLSGIGDYKYHALRHTFATNCIELGLDPKSLSEILGHSDIKITLSLYVHPSLDVKRDFVNKKLACLLSI